MALLHKPSVREGYKLVGASLPLRFHSYLTLYSIAKDVSKSDIIKQILEGWIDSKPLKIMYVDERILIQCIVDKVVIQWSIEKSKDAELTISIFMDQLRMEFEDKGIKTNYTRIILNEATKEITRHGKNE